MKKPMKKLLSILFVAALFCTMVTWPSRPVEAATDSDIRNQINVAASGSEITINLGSGNNYFYDEVFINKPITINFIGQPGAVIAGYKLNPYAHMLGNRAFKIMSDNVHLNFTNITFDPNCMSLGDNGGVIYIAGNNVSINGGIYKNNECGREKGGGAIYISNESGKGKNVTIENGQFENIHYNSVGYSAEKGGAIYVAGGCNNATIRGCTFTGFAATEDGGAIYLDADSAKVENCVFKQCRAREDDGGFIYVNGAYANIKNCKFDQSEAYDYGGAIYINKNNATIDGCSFSNCKASTEEGGAIYIKGESATINGCSFKGCTSNDEGGAIFVNNINANIKNSTFKDCIALSNDAGGVFVNKDNATISNCFFEGCQAIGSGSDGGAIKISYSGGTDGLRIEKCRFKDCKAQADGQWVDGRGPKYTTIVHCTLPYDEEHYYDDFSGGFACTAADLIKIENDKPNCTEDGIKPYYQCVCGSLFSDSNPSLSNMINNLDAWLMDPKNKAEKLGHDLRYWIGTGTKKTLTFACERNESHRASITLLEKDSTYPGNTQKVWQDVVSGDKNEEFWKELGGQGIDFDVRYYTAGGELTTPENSGAYDDPKKKYGFPPVYAGDYKLVVQVYKGTSPVYEARVEQPFTIHQKDINSQMVTLDPVDAEYTSGGSTTVTVTVMDGGKKLEADKDYEVDMAKSTITASAAGSYDVTIKGIGNYKGEATAKWSIRSAAALTLSGTLSAEPITYGGALSNDLIKSSGCRVMSGTTDVTAGGKFEWEDPGVIPDKAGPATYNVIFTPSDSAYGILKTAVTIDVLPQKLTMDDVTINTPDKYNGNDLKDYISVEDKSGKPYVKNVDYDVTGPVGEVKNPGHYIATIEFKGNYEGTVTQQFDVKRHLQEDDLTFIVDKYYEGEDAGDAITILLDGTKILERKIDYEISGTLDVSKAPLEYSYPATITFIEKYTGTISKTFVVEYPEEGPRPEPKPEPAPEPEPEPAPVPTPEPAPYHPSPTPSSAPTAPKGTIGGDTGTKITINTNDGNATISDVPASVISNAANTATGTDLLLDVSGTGRGLKKVSRVTIPKKTIENVVTVLNSPTNNKDRLVIKFDTATIAADAKSLASIAGQAKGDKVQFVVEAMTQSGLNNSQKSIVDGFNNSAGKNVEQIFQAYVESNGSRIPEFEGGIITVGMVDYKVPAGKNERNFHIYYLPTEGAREHCVTWIENKILHFGTGHFSDYAIVYDETMLNGPGNEVYRLFDTASGDHLFTISKAERDVAEKSGWKYEGVAFIAIEEGQKVYRLRYPQTGRHVYTASEKEKDALVAMGWTLEGTAFLSYGETEVLRLANPEGNHMFTANEKEKDALVKDGWKYEGVGFKAN